MHSSGSRDKISQHMKRAHLVFGILLFMAFLVTGRYMRADFPDKEIISQDLRLLMRSRHIYILFSSLIHVAIGVYFQRRTLAPARILQFAGSALLFIASGILLAAFIHETYFLQHFSEISRFGIYASLAGIILHALSSLQPVRKRSDL